MKFIHLALGLSVLLLNVSVVQADRPIIEVLQPGESSTFLLDRFGTNLIVRCEAGSAPRPVDYLCTALCAIGGRARARVEGYFRDRTESVIIQERLAVLCKDREHPNSSERLQVTAIDVKCQ